MTNLWHSFEQRLKSIANGDYRDAQDHNNPNRSALLFINPLFSASGALVGWYHPQVIRLEPKDINPLLIQDCQQVREWSEVINQVSEDKKDRVLIIRHGKPMAWFT
jgi:hypothetical protein